MSGALLDRAMQLTQQHRLRGYDAVQLAALTASAVLPPLTFLSADNDLIAAARSEGLSADNPNLHP
ncbi:MAG: type II toxin-antitoxin system VapC family toxin [Herpetosiphonaceae bacterium]|nr:type II toxin-antitoxin system VapC family toxin [Herpetosiphonaceae bacterium]